MGCMEDNTKALSKSGLVTLREAKAVFTEQIMNVDVLDGNITEEEGMVVSLGATVDSLLEQALATETSYWEQDKVTKAFKEVHTGECKAWETHRDTPEPAFSPAIKTAELSCDTNYDKATGALPVVADCYEKWEKEFRKAFESDYENKQTSYMAKLKELQDICCAGVTESLDGVHQCEALAATLGGLESNASNVLVKFTATVDKVASLFENREASVNLTEDARQLLVTLVGGVSDTEDALADEYCQMAMIKAMLGDFPDNFDSDAFECNKDALEVVAKESFLGLQLPEDRQPGQKDFGEAAFLEVAGEDNDADGDGLEVAGEDADGGALPTVDDVQAKVDQISETAKSVVDAAYAVAEGAASDQGAKCGANASTT